MIEEMQIVIKYYKKLKYENVASSSNANAKLKKTSTLILTSQSATSRWVNKMLKYKSVGVSLFSWGAVLLLWEKQHIFAYIIITEYDIFIYYVSYYYLIIKKNNNLWGFPNWIWKQIKRGNPHSDRE